MGRYDDITPERLRADLVSFARLILRLEQEDGVLASPADIQKLLGELRQKLFAYEVRASSLGLGAENNSRGSGPDVTSTESASDEPGMRESLKVVREAIRRHEEMIREWEGVQPEEYDDAE